MMQWRLMKILSALFGLVVILAACSNTDEVSPGISTANTGITTGSVHGFQYERMKDFSIGRQTDINSNLYNPATSARDFSIGMASLVNGTSTILDELSNADLGHSIESRSITSTARQF